MSKENKVKNLIKKLVGEIVTEAKRMNYKERDWKKINKIAKKKDVFIQTSYGDQFKWEEGSRYGVFATEDDGREIELDHDDIDVIMVEGKLDEKAKRDYKAEYKKYGSSKKAKKYRAELNKYNRQKGTYGNGDKLDASHKGGKIVGFEEQSKNRGRAEKSRLKKEEKLTEGFDLKKLEIVIKSIQKKIAKQGRVTNARDEEHLKQLIKVYKDMGGRKIKEAMSRRIAGKTLKIPQPGDFGNNMDKYFTALNKHMKEVEKLAKLQKKKGVKESVWALPKGATTTSVDELDAELSRAGIKSNPDFTKLLVQVSGNKSKINKIMKTHKAKKIFEGKLSEAIKKVSDAEDGAGFRQDWIGIYKGKFIQFKANFPVDAKKHTINYFKVPKSKYSEVVVISKKEYDVQQQLKVEQKLRKEIKEIVKEACQKGYMTHPTRKTKEMFGKRYRNCVKKENAAKNHDGKAAPYGSGYKKAKKKIKESQVAKTILQQLGGNKFIAMTGAKNLGASGKSLSMKIGRNSKSINYVVITLKSSDLYDVEFIRMRGAKRTVVKKVKGVYADMLQKIFTKYTGMRTSL